MNKNIVVGGVVAVAVLGGLFLLGGRTPAPGERGTGAVTNQLAAAALAPAEQSFGFGTVSMSRGTVNRTLTFKNAGNAPVGVARVYTSCMCTSATLVAGGRRIGPFGMPGHGFLPSVDYSVAPGDEVAVEVVFNPAAHGPAGIGRIARSVYLEGAEGRLATVNFTAFVTP